MTAVSLHTSSVSFEKDAALVTALLQDLQLEQTALINADLNRIEQMVDKRVELLQALGAAASARYEALALAGFEASEQGMAAWLSSQSNASLSQAWVEFQQQLINAKELNRLNGILINKEFQRNREKLDSLTGSTALPNFYGKNGHTNFSNDSKKSYIA